MDCSERRERSHRMARPKGYVVSLADADRERLRAIVAGRNSPQGEVLRSRVVLTCEAHPDWIDREGAGSIGGAWATGEKWGRRGGCQHRVRMADGEEVASAVARDAERAGGVSAGKTAEVSPLRYERKPRRWRVLFRKRWDGPSDAGTAQRFEIGWCATRPSTRFTARPCGVG